MKTAYTFNSTAAGGFTPAANAKEVYMLVCSKKSAHLIRKTEQMRIFTPEQNLDADAYKFDYRIYYDVFVKTSQLDSIWAWVSPAINITAQPAAKNVTEGSITEKLSVTATTASGSSLTYQWYSAADASKNGSVKVAGATSNQYTLPTDLAKGTYYYFVRITVDGIGNTDSAVAKVTVA